MRGVAHQACGIPEFAPCPCAGTASGSIQPQATGIASPAPWPASVTPLDACNAAQLLTLAVPHNRADQCCLGKVRLRDTTHDGFTCPSARRRGLGTYMDVDAALEPLCKQDCGPFLGLCCAQRAGRGSAAGRESCKLHG